MAGGRILDLSPEEQSFFEAGDAIDDEPATGEHETTAGDRGSRDSNGHHRYRSRRRARSPFSRRMRRKLRRSGWQKTIVSIVVTVLGVWAGYRASMYMVNRDLPTPDEVGVEVRGGH